MQSDDNPEHSRRLDHVLVRRGLAPSRSRARDLIRRGLVSIEGRAAAKPGQEVAGDARIALCEAGAAAAAHVSRGAEKLIAALDAFGFSPDRRSVLDIGASTGGFTQVLLARGAARVYAVDVGRSQLHASLAADPRVADLGGTDARRLCRALVPDPIRALTADVSFIALAKALPTALGLCEPGAWLVALVKPQFEAGPGAIGKGGIVRDGAVRERCVGEVSGWLACQGWHIAGAVPSPITGGDGNQEYLLGAVKHG